MNPARFVETLSKHCKKKPETAYRLRNLSEDHCVDVICTLNGKIRESSDDRNHGMDAIASCIRP